MVAKEGAEGDIRSRIFGGNVPGQDDLVAALEQAGWQVAVNPWQRNYWEGLANIAQPQQREVERMQTAEQFAGEEMPTRLINNFMLGCDPEFVVLQTPGRIVNVAALIPHDGEVGYDHNGRVAELRPQPSKSTFTLLKRIQKLILGAKVAEPIRPYPWRGGAFVKHTAGTDTLGGHVHIDVPFDSDRANTIIPTLDKVEDWLEKTDILPEKECLARREHAHPHQGGAAYGNFGDVRESNGHLEYRTFPSWLYSPYTALVCLTMAKIGATYPKDSYRFLVQNKPNKAMLMHYLGKYALRDTDVERTYGIVGAAMGQNPEANILDSWKELKGL